MRAHVPSGAVQSSHSDTASPSEQTSNDANDKNNIYDFFISFPFDFKKQKNTNLLVVGMLEKSYTLMILWLLRAHALYCMNHSIPTRRRDTHNMCHNVNDVFHTPKV